MSWHKEDYIAMRDRAWAFVLAHKAAFGIAGLVLLGMIIGRYLFR